MHKKSNKDKFYSIFFILKRWSIFAFYLLNMYEPVGLTVGGTFLLKIFAPVFDLSLQKSLMK